MNRDPRIRHAEQLPGLGANFVLLGPEEELVYGDYFWDGDEQWQMVTGWAGRRVSECCVHSSEPEKRQFVRCDPERAKAFESAESIPLVQMLAALSKAPLSLERAEYLAKESAEGLVKFNPNSIEHVALLLPSAGYSSKLLSTEEFDQFIALVEKAKRNLTCSNSPLETKVRMMRQRI